MCEKQVFTPHFCATPIKGVPLQVRSGFRKAEWRIGSGFSGAEWRMCMKLFYKIVAGILLCALILSDIPVYAYEDVSGNNASVAEREENGVKSDITLNERSLSKKPLYEMNSDVSGNNPQISEPTCTPKATSLPTETPQKPESVNPVASCTPESKPTEEPDIIDPNLDKVSSNNPTLPPEGTPTPTVTPSATPTASPSATPSATPTATPSATPTATPSATPTATPSATPAPTPVIYYVIYELDGGVNNASNPVSFGKNNKSVKLAEPSKTGYIFEGWYADEKYTDGIYKIPAKCGANITLYAKWSPVRYSIHFDGNRATKGTMKDMNAEKYDSSFRLKKNSFSRSGYEFVGWNTKKNGKGENFSDKQKVSNLCCEAGACITLYAVWQPVKYTVTYDTKKGTNSKYNPSEYTAESETITLKNPKKTGYKFLGWYSDSKYKHKVKSIKKGSTGDIKLYAKWEVYTYSIIFDKNGADKGSMSKMSGLKYTSSYKLKANKFTKNGCEFTGWNTAKDGSGTSFADEAKVKKLICKNKGIVTLYAQWDVGTYNIAFDGNGATKGAMDKIRRIPFDETFFLPINEFTRDGYAFMGWNTAKDGSGTFYQDQQIVSGIGKSAKSTITLFAIWKRKSQAAVTMTNSQMFEFFISQGMSEYGAAGLMGNLYAESGLRSNNLQTSYERTLGMTDTSYTDAVDDYTYGNFANDAAGYGLAQWTSPGRKQGLLNYARATDTSVCDINMQLNYLMQELVTTYASVYNVLKSAQSVREASDAVILHYEMPSDQSEAAQLKRASYGMSFLKEQRPGLFGFDNSACPFEVKVSISNLNVRSDAGTENGVVCMLAPGTYTITEVKAGTGSTLGFGKLSSGIGWIALDYCEKVVK